MNTLAQQYTPMERLQIIKTGNEKQDAEREKQVHACLNILKLKNKHDRIRMFFMYYPAVGQKTAGELSAKYNNLFWHFRGIVNNVEIQEFGYDGDKDYISGSSMLYHLEKMEKEGCATNKLRARGWYVRKLWSTNCDIPF